MQQEQIRTTTRKRMLVGLLIWQLGLPQQYLVAVPCGCSEWDGGSG